MSGVWELQSGPDCPASVQAAQGSVLLAACFILEPESSSPLSSQLRSVTLLLLQSTEDWERNAVMEN